jgi:two-component system, cell cycle sensor histidine kinase and response regulator CckA
LKEIMKSLFNWHTDTILIVEPDQVLRQLECRALSGKYRIIQTTCVEEAVRTAARHTTEIDLLVTEVRLPHLFGWEVTELLKLDYPDLKVVYTSKSIDAKIRARTYPSKVIVTENPFRPDLLRQAVRDALKITQCDRIAPNYLSYAPPVSQSRLITD